MCSIKPGIPHKSLEDDVYQDMFIPKGVLLPMPAEDSKLAHTRSNAGYQNRGYSIWQAQVFLISSRSVVYANAHAMAHDERIYGAPHDFNPDRYAPRTDGGLGEPFPVGNFGFGRR
jgi:hypothetical protein